MGKDVDRIIVFSVRIAVDTFTGPLPGLKSTLLTELLSRPRSR